MLCCGAGHKIGSLSQTRYNSAGRPLSLLPRDNDPCKLTSNIFGNCQSLKNFELSKYCGTILPLQASRSSYRRRRLLRLNVAWRNSRKIRHWLLPRKNCGVRSTNDVARPLRFHRFLTPDLREATDWYDEISATLGNRFRAAVQDALRQIQRSPAAGPLVPSSSLIRFYRVRRFPYLVLYHFDRETPLIVGIAHSSSDLQKWLDRVQE